jgi:hypothetical protein
VTLPVYNQKSALVIVKNGFGFLIPPWNSFFQQFTQPAPSVASVSNNPFQANANGTLIITGTVINLTRGSDTIALGNGQKIIPISIGDIVSWATASAVQFLGA